MPKNSVSVPTVKKVKSTAMDSLKAGGLGGVLAGIGHRVGGELGAGIGGILAGSMLGGKDGRIISDIAVYDSVASFLSQPPQTTTQSNGGVI